MAEELTATQKAASLPERVREYLDDLQQEMKRVTWPSWKQVRATTAVVIGAVFLFSLYFFVVDTVVGRAIQKLFDTFSR